MFYLTFIKHLLIHPVNSPNLSLETIPRFPAKLGNQISAYVPGRFAKISRDNSHDGNSVDERRIPFVLNEVFISKVTQVEFYKPHYTPLIAVLKTSTLNPLYRKHFRADFCQAFYAFVELIFS